MILYLPGLCSFIIFSISLKVEQIYISSFVKRPFQLRKETTQSTRKMNATKLEWITIFSFFTWKIIIKNDKIEKHWELFIVFIVAAVFISSLCCTNLINSMIALKCQIKLNHMITSFQLTFMHFVNINVCFANFLVSISFTLFLHLFLLFSFQICWSAV